MIVVVIPGPEEKYRNLLRIKRRMITGPITIFIQRQKELFCRIHSYYWLAVRSQDDRTFSRSYGFTARGIQRDGHALYRVIGIDHGSPFLRSAYPTHN